MNWLEKHHKAQEQLRELSLELQRMARCQYAVGNTYMWERLTELSSDLNVLIELENDSVNQKLNRDMDTVNRRVASVLNTLCEKVGITDE